MKSQVESYFRDCIGDPQNQLSLLPLSPIITADYVILGQLTALRFLEWVCTHPGGVIALPTGKTPEFFIKWTAYYLARWEKECTSGLPARLGFEAANKPQMQSLTFFQLDEFFPIHPSHDRSFSSFVKKFYIEGFGLDPEKVHLLYTHQLDDESRTDLCSLFSDGMIDLSLRYRPVITEEELNKKRAILQIDQMCQAYEESIKSAGGIGFFLGGIGPDGHIAFNIRGSAHDSHTRLDFINYETQAAAASDLGGIENVRRKAVLTMGLGTITMNPDCCAVIIAAGAGKAKVVADALLQKPSAQYPATALHKLPNARLFLSRSASSFLIPPVQANTAEEHEAYKCGLIQKIEKGLQLPSGKIIMHTAPHHDDIELAYFPAIHHLVRSQDNTNHFVYCTSGFTAVTNNYLKSVLMAASAFISNGAMKNAVNAYELFSSDRAYHDITGYLNGIANQNKETQLFNLSTRMVRRMIGHTGSTGFQGISDFIQHLNMQISALEPGSREPETIHLVKGWIREFEAELAWAHFGIGNEYVHHLRLKFYSDDIFPDYPDYGQDVMPLFRMMMEISPDIITMAIDPEGSGPDTHYKSLMAISAAVDEYIRVTGRTDIRLWGYRNVWSRFDPREVNTIIPVSLNSLAVLHNMFNSCFLSQRSASFPSYEFEGTFSELAQKIWVEQPEVGKEGQDEK